MIFRVLLEKFVNSRELLKDFGSPFMVNDNMIRIEFVEKC